MECLEREKERERERKRVRKREIGIITSQIEFLTFVANGHP